MDSVQISQVCWIPHTMNLISECTWSSITFAVEWALEAFRSQPEKSLSRSWRYLWTFSLGTFAHNCCAITHCTAHILLLSSRVYAPFALKSAKWNVKSAALIVLMELQDHARCKVRLFPDRKAVRHIFENLMAILCADVFANPSHSLELMRCYWLRCHRDALCYQWWVLVCFHVFWHQSAVHFFVRQWSSCLRQDLLLHSSSLHALWQACICVPRCVT